MSDISSDSSFQLVSDSDHSDVDEPSIASDQLNVHTVNKNQSGAVEPRVVKTGGPKVIVKETSTSSKKEIPNRRQKNQSDDTDLLNSGQLNVQEVLTTRAEDGRKEKRKLVVELTSFHVAIIFVVLVVAFAVGWSAKSSTVPIDKNINETIKHLGNIFDSVKDKKHTFLQEARLGKDEIDRFMHMVKPKNSTLRVTWNGQIPENQWNEFIANITRFEEVEDFIQYNGRKLMISYSYSRANFTFYPEKPVGDKHQILVAFLKGEPRDTTRTMGDIWMKDCLDVSKCNKLDFTVKNDELHFVEKIGTENLEYEFTRVYSILPLKWFK